MSLRGRSFVRAGPRPLALSDLLRQIGDGAETDSAVRVADLRRGQAESRRQTAQVTALSWRSKGNWTEREAPC